MPRSACGRRSPWNARAGDGIALQSIDTDREVSARHWSELDPTGQLPLLVRAARHYRIEHVSVTTQAESPAGAGIAGSSALTIALCGAFARLTGASMNPDDIMQIAMNVECQTIRVPTGVQDYRPAMYGGIAAIELGADGIKRVALDVDPRELEQRIVLAYTGEPRHVRDQQLGDHQTPHRRRPRHLRLLRADPRHGGGHASGAGTAAIGTKSAGKSPWSGTTGSALRRE